MPTPAERVASDANLRAVLEAARSWGVSPSVFLGRPLVTTYQHDDAGRVVRAETESPWTRDDADLAVALADYDADCCPSCGGHLPETTLAANEENYDAKVGARCHRCTALDIAQHQAQHMPHPSALLLSATLKTQGAQNDSSLPTD